MIVKMRCKVFLFILVVLTIFYLKKSSHYLNEWFSKDINIRPSLHKTSSSDSVHETASSETRFIQPAATSEPNNLQSSQNFNKNKEIVLSIKSLTDTGNDLQEKANITSPNEAQIPYQIDTIQNSEKTTGLSKPVIIDSINTGDVFNKDVNNASVNIGIIENSNNEDNRREKIESYIDNRNTLSASFEKNYKKSADKQNKMIEEDQMDSAITAIDDPHDTSTNNLNFMPENYEKAIMSEESSGDGDDDTGDEEYRTTNNDSNMALNLTEVLTSYEDSKKGPDILPSTNNYKANGSYNSSNESDLTKEFQTSAEIGVFNNISMKGNKLSMYSKIKILDENQNINENIIDSNWKTTETHSENGDGSQEIPAVLAPVVTSNINDIVTDDITSDSKLYSEISGTTDSIENVTEEIKAEPIINSAVVTEDTNDSPKESTKDAGIKRNTELEDTQIYKSFLPPVNNTIGQNLVITDDNLNLQSSDNTCITSIKASKRKAKYDKPHHCLFFSETFDICKIAKIYYPDRKIKKSLKCRSKEFPSLCQYKESTEQPKISSAKLSCNISSCKANTVGVTMLNDSTGLMYKIRVRNSLTLEHVIENERRKQKAKYSPFVFVSCTPFKERVKIRQLLILPPVPSKQQKNHQSNREQQQQQEKLNINIIVIDSLSRQHFYRILPRTVKAMKEINDKNFGSEVLDFKGMQSLAPFTYVNVNALMNGTIGQRIDNGHRKYAIETLFTKFKQAGYQTLLQEEACWYNQWGSLLTGNVKINRTVDISQLWSRLKNDSYKSNVDSYGLTHMTCEALRKYKMTSLFDSVKVLCLNGKPLSYYFTDYIKRKMNYRVKKLLSKPLFSYTHLNFAHEKTSYRAKALDDDLSSFVKFSSNKNDTLTIFWSDHGNKQSKYSMATLTGRYEIYDSLLFMVLPEKLKTILTAETYDTLQANQESLINILDVRDTILLLKDLDLTTDNNHPKLDNKDLSSSLFSPTIQSRRNCKPMNIRKYALCKCISNTTFIDLAEDIEYKSFLLWLAEHSIGYLNNKLTNYQTPFWTRNQQKCIRFEARKIKLVIEEQTSLGVLYTFDIITEKFGGIYESFNIRLFYNSHRNSAFETVSIQYWSRVSTYQGYVSCHDFNVPINLCACSNTSSAKFKTKNDVGSYTQFGTRSTTIHPVNHTLCLQLLKRNHGNVVTFELLNRCDITMAVTFDIDFLSSWQIDQSLPMDVSVQPYQIIFVATFLKAFKMDEPLVPVITINNPESQM